MPPYQALYGIPCRTPLSWDRLEDRVLVGLSCFKRWKSKWYRSGSILRKHRIDKRAMLLHIESIGVMK